MFEWWIVNGALGAHRTGFSKTDAIDQFDELRK